MAGEQVRNVQMEEKKEKEVSRFFLKSLAFFQMWFGSCLFIVGIALTIQYTKYYLAVLIDGLLIDLSAALAFFQMWFGSCLFIVGLALTIQYTKYYLAVLIDGLLIALSAALGGMAVYYPEKQSLYCLRKWTILLQTIVGLGLLFFYIWCASEIHLPFVAFVVFELINVVIAIVVFLVYINRIYPNNLSCVLCLYEDCTSDEEAATQQGGVVGNAEVTYPQPPIYEELNNGPPPAYENAHMSS